MTTVLARASGQTYPRTAPLSSGEAAALGKLITSAGDPTQPLLSAVRDAFYHRVVLGCYTVEYRVVLARRTVEVYQLTVTSEIAWLTLAHAVADGMRPGAVKDALTARLEPKGKHVEAVILEARSAARA